MDRYWKSLFDIIKSRLYRSSLSEDEKHYGFWLLKTYPRLAEVLHHCYPLFKEIKEDSRKKVVNYLNRQIRKYRKKYPRVKLSTSFVLDDNCYSLFKHEGRQYSI